MTPKLQRPFEMLATHVDYWPSYVDVLTIVLMVFILQNFLQTVPNVDVYDMMRLRQAQDDLEQALREEFSGEVLLGKIHFESSPNLLRVRFSEELLFPTKEYRLAEAGAQIMQRCAKVLGTVDESLYKKIQVEGHTDNVPLLGASYPSNNWQLSSARALDVVTHMTTHGIRPEKLSANAYGEFDPFAGNDDPQGQAQNRRIELLIVFSLPGRTTSSPSL